MFVQQMHFYNTLIEDISQGQEFNGGTGSAAIASNQNCGKNRLLNSEMYGKDANICNDSNSPRNDEEDIPSNIKSFNEALDKLRTYERRALNLFR